MTREKFLAAYRAELLDPARGYEWVKSQTQLDRFMRSVETTISTERKTWNHDTPSTNAAWRKAGCKGRVTLAGLRALPTEKTDGPDT